MYHCSQCKYVTHHKGNFVKHQRIHTGFDISTATYEHNIDRKLIREPKTFKTYNCTMFLNCFRVSSLSSDRGSKLRGTSIPYKSVITSPAHHLSVTLHSCSYCKYETFYRGDLIKHLRKHTGERPFSCQVISRLCSIRLEISEKEI
ncbi:Zinc finger protein 394 like protein [Argiope bruennichi]|uniref:Zinc finger protein 394 like protein n=1 Tax=Argiope bruennichi TaxID=94029 RepID=A0A8T0E890_ARGBR|nr:Zinc finger protein 394 like protein [Argiope bruennichi]